MKRSLGFHSSLRELFKVLELFPFATFIIDSQHRVIFCNRAYENLTGNKRKDIILTSKQWSPFYYRESKTLADLVVDKSSLKDVKRHYGKHARYIKYTDSAYTLEIHFPRLGESGKWIFCTASSLLNRKGQLVGAIQTLQDLTGHKNDKDALFKSEQQSRTILNQIEDGYYEVDLHGRIITVNNSFCRILGYSNRDLPGMSYKDLRGNKGFKEIYTMANSVYRSGKPLKTTEMEVVRKDGSWCVVEISVSLIKDAQGNSTGFRGILRDITEIRKAELEIEKYEKYLEELVLKRTDRLIKTNRRLRKEIGDRKRAELDLMREKKFEEDIIESIPAMFYVIDENFKLIRWNKNAEMVTGYTSDELQQFNTLDFFGSNDLGLIKEKFQEVLNKGRTSVYVRFMLKNGTIIPTFITGVGTTINNNYYQVGVGIDCTEIEDAKSALLESEERLSLAADSAEAGLWSLNIDTDSIWATTKALGLHGVAMINELSYANFLEVIHPEDREQVRQAVEQGIQSREDISIEYRIVLPDGGIRWLYSRGRLRSKSSQIPDRLMGVSMDITERKRMDAQLQERLKEIEGLKEQLEQENVYLREEVKILFEDDGILGESEAIRKVLSQAEQVAPTDTMVLILGETGTGKELLARAIHNMSRRKDRPLVTVNCASLPPSLIESELFGRERGAYTGALTRMVGRFETADGSTLFLDEIGELPYELQSKLLRVLESGKFERLGSPKTIKVNVRLIAATNRDITQDIKEGKFRKDLYYRLNVFPIVIPPLRERTEDIFTLVWAFVRQYEKKLGKRIDSIPTKSMDALQRYPWPGNIRELKNVIERAMIISNKTLEISPPALPLQLETDFHTLEDIERRHILEVLERTGWRVAGRDGAAEILGLKRSTLRSKMKALGITRSIP